MKTSLHSLALALAGFIAAAPLALAHSVWIEDTSEKQLVVRFGDLGGEIEKSPGALDRLSHLVAWTPGEDSKPSPFNVEKKSDHFLFAGASPAAPALAETGFPVMGKEGKPASKPHFYVRWHPAGSSAPATPALTLDILPTATPGEFQVFFRGQRLPGAVVTVHGGKDEEKAPKLTADTEGVFKFTAPAGIALLTCNHKEQLTGFAAGKTYAITSHNAALTWRQP